MKAQESEGMEYSSGRKRHQVRIKKKSLIALLTLKVNSINSLHTEDPFKGQRRGQKIESLKNSYEGAPNSSRVKDLKTKAGEAAAPATAVR